MIRSIRFKFARIFLRIAVWFLPQMTYDDWRDDLIWWLAHNKKQKFLIKEMATRPYFGGSGVGDDGKTIREFMEELAQEDEKKELEIRRRYMKEWVK